jgi:hypothetical protein
MAAATQPQVRIAKEVSLEMHKPEPLDAQLAGLIALLWKLERAWSREDHIMRS